MTAYSFQFLGTGASAGIPLIGCTCSVCQSGSHKNRRLRSSGVLRIQGKTFLIDAGPDVRQQLLTWPIEQLDALLITHIHYDHIAGLDELRPFNFRQGGAIPCVLSQESLETLQVRSNYLFATQKENETQSARFQFIPLKEETGSFTVAGIPFTYFSYGQGGVHVTGFRYKHFAYITDIRDYASSIFDALDGIQTLIISALRQEPSPVQFSLEEAIEFAQRTGCQQAWITHISHAMEHDQIEKILPAHIHMGYDGLLLQGAPFNPEVQ